MNNEKNTIKSPADVIAVFRKTVINKCVTIDAAAHKARISVPLMERLMYGILYKHTYMSWKTAVCFHKALGFNPEFLSNGSGGIFDPVLLPGETMATGTTLVRFTPNQLADLAEIIDTYREYCCADMQDIQKANALEDRLNEQTDGEFSKLRER